MIINTNQWFSDGELKRLFEALGAAGETRFIGGAVRDAVLDLKHSDIDLATVLRPDEVLAQAGAAGFKLVPTGIDHGTVTAVLDRGPVEITTLRRDVATDGRHAEVEYTDRWEEDAARRDFTINALSADADGNIHDYFGGIADLDAGRVRFIGEAATRIAEDYLRVLRFFRFSGRFAKTLDGEALAAIHEAAPKVATLSGERLLAETLKILGGKRALEMIGAMAEAGVLAAYLPQHVDLARLERVIASEESVGVVDPVRRLIALLPPLGPESVAAAAERLRLSGVQRTRLAAAQTPLPDQPARISFYEDGPAATLDRAFLSGMDTEPLAALLIEALNWARPSFPLGGEQLKQLGMAPGPIFGELLREVEAWWVAQDFKPTRQECFQHLKELWAKRKKN
jgi:poly(A) polymerase